MSADRVEAAIRELAAALREEIAAEAQAIPGAPEKLYSVEDAAELLGIGRTALYGELQAGRCRSIKVGRRRLIPASSIREYSQGRSGGE